MKLRIITGSLKGRVIETSYSKPGFRATLERVREAVAESIKLLLPNAVVADVCAGTGAFGFEMLSRGARTVHFFEHNITLVRGIQKHAQKFGVEKQCFQISHDISRGLGPVRQKFDVIFYDPPYGVVSLQEIIPDMLGYLTENGVLIYQHDNTVADVVMQKLSPYIQRTKKYGRTWIEFMGQVEKMSEL